MVDMNSKKQRVYDLIVKKATIAINSQISNHTLNGRAESALRLAEERFHLSRTIADEVCGDVYAMMELQDIMDWKFRKEAK